MIEANFKIKNIRNKIPSKTKEFPSFVNPFWFLYPLKKKSGSYIPSKNILVLISPQTSDNKIKINK